MSVRVTHVVRQYYPSVGGMEEVVRSIAASQQQQTDQTVRIVTLNRLFRSDGDLLPPREEVAGVPVVRLPFHGSSRYPLCPRVLTALAETDVIHVHGVDFFYDFLAATRLLHRCPLVLSTHGGFFHTDFASGLKEFWFNTITRWSARAYERIVATSENDGRRFRQIVRPSRLEVIENGVDTGKYADAGARTFNRTLIYFGRWSSNKGLAEALDLMTQLSRSDPRWRLVIAGREYDHTAASLGQEVARRDLTGRVTLAPNPSDDALKALLGQASFFLCLSRHEGFGLAAIEAMSAGLTPILSDIPPFARLVARAGVGVAAPAGDGSGMARQLEQLAAAGQGGHEHRREQATAFVSRYSWASIASRYIQLYEELGGQP